MASEQPDQDRYRPELGQAMFGAPWGEFRCPELLIAALRYLDEQIEIATENGGKSYSSPMANTGADWANDTFELHAYYWGDDEEEAVRPNFKWRDVEVRWYKGLGRGTTVNRPVSADEISLLLKVCAASIERADRLDGGD